MNISVKEEKRNGREKKRWAALDVVPFGRFIDCVASGKVSVQIVRSCRLWRKRLVILAEVYTNEYVETYWIDEYSL